MKSLNDSFKLSNGVEIPCVGFGTWQTPDGQTAIDAVKYAIRTGYRHIDTAAVYGNEKSIGEAIRESGVDRKDLFVTSKLWNTERGYDKALKAFAKTLKDLGLKYLDLYLIHWPSNRPDGAKVNADTWRAFEKLYDDGLIRSIGVSNFLAHHLEALFETARTLPMVDQIEFHPGHMQRKTVDFCHAEKIVVEAWSPLGSGRVLSDLQLEYIAAKYHKSVAQLCIRWCLQNHTLPLPKSVTPSRIAENADVFDFEISPGDMRTIDGMAEFGGSGLDPDSVKF